MFESEPLFLNVTTPTALEMLTSEAPAQPAWMHEGHRHAVTRLEGPSTLALALVGAVLLLAYQKISERLNPATMAPAHGSRGQKPRTSRRRAA